MDLFPDRPFGRYDGSFSGGGIDLAIRSRGVEIRGVESRLGFIDRNVRDRASQAGISKDEA